MNNNEMLLKKMCSFYVSDLHMVTMLLPYINKKLTNKKKVITILEEDLSNEVDILVSKLTLGEESRKRVLEVNWNNTNLYKYESMKDYLDTATKKEKEVYIIIKGLKHYIDNTNASIQKWISEKKDKSEVRINIINCFEVTEFNENILEILNEHDKILNTSGEKEINDVFEGYGKKQEDVLKEAN